MLDTLRSLFANCRKVGHSYYYRILKPAVDAEKSIEFVAKWYGAEIDEVMDAVQFETKPV